MYLQRLRDLREDKELFQSDIAKLLKTTQPQYSKYENGERELPIRHLIILADFYNTSADYILGRTNEISPYHKKMNHPLTEKTGGRQVINFQVLTQHFVCDKILFNTNCVVCFITINFFSFIFLFVRCRLYVDLICLLAAGQLL